MIDNEANCKEENRNGKKEISQGTKRKMRAVLYEFTRMHLEGKLYTALLSGQEIREKESRIDEMVAGLITKQRPYTVSSFFHAR